MQNGDDKVSQAEAARTYARAAKLGLDAQNHAAEVKIRAERKAGDLLRQLERSNHDRGNQYKAKFQDGTQPSEYREVLEEQDIPTTTAHRWQQAAEIALNAKRKAGEFLAQLEQGRGGDRKSKNQTITRDSLISPFAEAVQGAGISTMDAVRWQQIAAVPEQQAAFR